MGGEGRDKSCKRETHSCHCTSRQDNSDLDPGRRGIYFEGTAKWFSGINGGVWRGRREYSTVNRLIGDLCSYKNGLVMGVAILGVKSGIQVFTIWWLKQQRTCLQCRRFGLDPWVGKIPWRRAQQPISVFLPGKSHGQRSLAGYSPWGPKCWTQLGDFHFTRIQWALDIRLGVVKGLLCITLEFREGSWLTHTLMSHHLGRYWKPRD